MWAVSDSYELGVAGRLVGTITVLAESDAYQHANATYPLSLTLPHERVSADHDSLGLFQQRPQWWFVDRADDLDSRVRSLMDDTVSAQLFYRELRGLPGWRAMDPWIAAQRIQRSGFTDGSNYQARMATALAALAGGSRYFTNLGGKK